ncbi:MAG: very short patch repair endonuclease [Microbacterium sp.]|uniref:very short patch repair endonuclease n=1 Tax=Microbacterium sp. TaxID=51671 RepID=UPI0039E4C470
MGESWATSEATRRSMLGNRSRDTTPELAVRRRLHALGYRYRVDVRPEPAIRRRADVVFTRQRVAVFIDGCFWHQCPEHFRMPAANREYWSAKIERNHERDAETSARLAEAGWTVLRFWEHEPVDEIVERIADAVARRRPRGA